MNFNCRTYLLENTLWLMTGLGLMTAIALFLKAF